MANLIPPLVKRQIVREYRVRLGSVAMLLVSVVCAAIAALMIPTYLLVMAQYAAATSEHAASGSKKDTYEAGKKEVETANELALYIEKQGTWYSLAELTATVDTLAGEHATIRAYTFTDESGESPVLGIEGVAGDRTRLTQFKDLLEQSGRFVSVELPLSSLAGDRDIAFSMKAIVDVP